MRASLKLLRTSTFRLTLLYLAVFTVSVGAILGYVYWNTAVLLERQAEETIRAEIKGLEEQVRAGGLASLIDTLRRRSVNAAEEIYLVVDPFGRTLAGNLDALPAAASGQSGWIDFPYIARAAKGVEPHQAVAFLTRLPNGFVILVGRDVQERRQFALLMRHALFVALGLMLVLGLAGGILMGRNFLHRIDSINATARAIMAGDLSERMPVGGSGDELDRLAQSLNEMLDQIERLMDGLKEVSSNIAHDLKTPLTRLRARVEDALRSDAKPAYRAALEQTLGEADHLLQTFNALLSIARTEAGQAGEGLRPIDAGEVVEGLADLYTPKVEEEGGVLSRRIARGLTIRADRQLLAQAVTNLIDNAIKYGKPDGGNGARPTVELAVEREPDGISIAVADNGPGIPEADRERVTERFVRLDASRTKPGNGLGLSLVAGVMKLHGGRLALADNHPGLVAKLILPPVDGAR